MVAEIFSYVGYKEEGEVSDLMQSCSHLTRAYFINAGLLKGFLLVKPDYLKGIPSFRVISRFNPRSLTDADLLASEFCGLSEEFKNKMIELKA